MSPPDGLSGSLSTLALPELLAKLHAERASGEVEVRLANAGGSIWLVDGELHDAHLHPHRGLAALDRLLELQRGEFRFRPGSQSRRRSLFDAFEPILAGHAQREAKRAALIRRLLVTNLSLVLDQEMLGDARLDTGDERCQLLQLVNGQRTASQVVEQSQLPPTVALRDLADWYDLGVVKPLADDALQAPATRRGPTQERRELPESAPVPAKRPELSEGESAHSAQRDSQGSHRTAPRTVVISADSRSADAPPYAGLSSPSARTIPEIPAARLPRTAQPSEVRSVGALTAHPVPEETAVPKAVSESPGRSSAVRTLIAFPSPLKTFGAQTAPRHASDRSRAVQQPSDSEPTDSEPPSSGPIVHRQGGLEETRHGDTVSFNSPDESTAVQPQAPLNSRTLLGFPTAVSNSQFSNGAAPTSTGPSEAATTAGAVSGASQLGIEDRLALFDKSLCLARGRDSSVYLVSRGDEVLVLKAPRAGTPSQQRRMRHEVRLMRQLEHENLVTLRESSDRPDAPYVLMDYVEGITLADLFRAEQSLSPDAALSIIHDLLAAVDYLHHAVVDGTPGLIHANLEPHNVIVGLDGRTRLLDLGEARRPGVDHGETDAHAEARFSSPEALAGEPLYPASDVYSLGILMQELARKFPSPARQTMAGASAFLEVARRAATADRPRRPESVAELAAALGVTLNVNPRHAIVSEWIRHLPEAAPEQRPQQRLRHPVAELFMADRRVADADHRRGAPAGLARFARPPVLVAMVLLLIAFAVYLFIRSTQL